MVATEPKVILFPDTDDATPYEWEVSEDGNRVGFIQRCIKPGLHTPGAVGFGGYHALRVGSKAQFDLPDFEAALAYFAAP